MFRAWPLCVVRVRVRRGSGRSGRSRRFGASRPPDPSQLAPIDESHLPSLDDEVRAVGLTRTRLQPSVTERSSNLALLTRDALCVQVARQGPFSPRPSTQTLAPDDPPGAGERPPTARPALRTRSACLRSSFTRPKELFGLETAMHCHRASSEVRFDSTPRRAMHSVPD
jgi:hypothetical protein